MKAIPLTDEELAEKQKAFESMNELVYDKKKEKKDVKSKTNRRLSQVR